MFHIETFDDDVHIRVRGDLDRVNVPELKIILDGIDQRGKMGVHLDLRACTYIDTAAIAVIVVQRRFRGTRFHVKFDTGSLSHRLFDIVGLTEHFTPMEPRP